jgi:O-antigen/teichoic acid export membrane protein
LSISPSLRGDAVYEFRLIALAIPFVIGAAALRGVLEGALRFDLVNFVRIPLNLSAYLIPLGGALLHMSVPGIIALMVATRCIGLVAYLVLCRIALPELSRKPSFDSATVVRLISYGGWVSVSNLIQPIYTQLDRYMIGATVGVAALTFYSVPFEILTGLSILPISLLSSLFPLISGLRGSERESSLEAVYARPLKYLALALGPIVLALVTFSHDVLLVWQGAAFADKSTLVLQILLIGSFVNALAMVPGTWLLGISRPDVVAKILLIELPVYIPLAYILISRYGIVGAALAFTPRVALEAALYFVFSFRLHQAPFRSFAAARFGSIAIWLFLLAAVIWPLGRLSEGAGMHILSVVVCVCAFWIWAWLRFLDDIDHAFLRGCFSVLTKPAGLTKTA